MPPVGDGRGSAGRALEYVRRERAGVDAELPPGVEVIADLVQVPAQRGHDGLLLLVGAVLEFLPGEAPVLGEAAVADPAPALQVADALLHDLGGPAAGGRVGQQ